MGSLPFTIHNLTQIFFALLPDKLTGQNTGKREKLSEIQDLLKFGLDVNAEILPGYTALCKIIEGGGSFSLVKLLLDAGAKLDIGNPHYEWHDDDGNVYRNPVLALARQRFLKEKDQESLEIQALIQRKLPKIERKALNPSLSLSEAPSSAKIEDESIDIEEFDKTRTPKFEDITDTEDNVNVLENQSKYENPIQHIDSLTKRKLYIFEFDNCMVNGNFHHILKNMGVAYGHASSDLVAFLFERYGLKNQELLSCIVRDILKQGDCIGIASHSRYPETVFAALKRLGLSEGERANLYYEPPIQNSEVDLTQGKNVEILKAMVHFEVIDINTVYLIDPDKTNLQIAKSRLNIPEQNLIRVDAGNDPFPTYLQALQKTLRKVHEDLQDENFQRGKIIPLKEPEVEP